MTGGKRTLLELFEYPFNRGLTIEELKLKVVEVLNQQFPNKETGKGNIYGIEHVRIRKMQGRAGQGGAVGEILYDASTLRDNKLMDGYYLAFSKLTVPEIFTENHMSMMF